MLLPFAVDPNGRISLESRTLNRWHLSHGEVTPTSRGSLPVSNGRHGTTGIFGKSAKTDKGKPFCVA